MTKVQAGTILTSQVMDCQVHTIGKAIRPLFFWSYMRVGGYYYKQIAYYYGNP